MNIYKWQLSDKVATLSSIRSVCYYSEIRNISFTSMVFYYSSHTNVLPVLHRSSVNQREAVNCNSKSGKMLRDISLYLFSYIVSFLSDDEQGNCTVQSDTYIHRFLRSTFYVCVYFL